MKGRVAHCVAAGALAAAAAVAAPNATAAVDMFLKIEGVKGESKDAKHAGEIDVLAWSWGLAATKSGGAQKAVPCTQHLSLTKWVDKATPLLVRYAVLGASSPKGTLVVRKAGESPLEYIVVTMDNVIVSSVSTGGSGGEDRLTENVTFGFSEAKIEYTEQLADGKQGAKTDAFLPASCP
jgi:type VI secretion system secreted protein Hcp